MGGPARRDARASMTARVRALCRSFSHLRRDVRSTPPSLQFAVQRATQHLTATTAPNAAFPLFLLGEMGATADRSAGAARCARPVAHREAQDKAAGCRCACWWVGGRAGERWAWTNQNGRNNARPCSVWQKGSTQAALSDNSTIRGKKKPCWHKLYGTNSCDERA